MAKTGSSKKRKTDVFQDNKQSLQERLHTLLTRLSDIGEILKKWPETKTGDDSSIHTRTTAKLISEIQRTIEGIKLVEEKVNAVPSENVKSEDAIANKLRQTAVPLDLLDMMDFAGGLNPDCFARGLIKEALRQMGNLQRRKASMRMLAVAIKNGMERREEQLKILASLDEKLASKSESKLSVMIEGQEDKMDKKRKRDTTLEDAPPAKR